MKVLLVEDEVQMSEAIAGLLRKNKFLVECAFDGEEGLQMGLVGDYDVIIMDIMMTVIDGYEVVRLLRKRGITTPIIMLTALSSVDDKVKGLDIGADSGTPIMASAAGTVVWVQRLYSGESMQRWVTAGVSGQVA